MASTTLIFLAGQALSVSHTPISPSLPADPGLIRAQSIHLRGHVTFWIAAQNDGYSAARGSLIGHSA
jgi:hypothetical protein